MFLIPVRIECCLGRFDVDIFDNLLELSAAWEGLTSMFLISVRMDCCLGRFDVDVFDTC